MHVITHGLYEDYSVKFVYRVPRASDMKRDVGRSSLEERSVDMALQCCWGMCIGEGRAAWLADHRAGVGVWLGISAQVGQGRGDGNTETVVDGGGLVNGVGGRGLGRRRVIHFHRWLWDLFS